MRLLTILILLTGLTGMMGMTHAESADEYLKAEMAKRHIPGLSVAVVQSGRVVKASGEGFASVELSVAPTADTVYPIASMSKQFTAMGILLLVQDGKLRLDDAVGRFVNYLPKTWQSITVRQLLNQTSGVPDWQPDPDRDPLLKVYAPTEIINHAAAQPLAFKPGSRFEYSNMNYSLLAAVIEKVTGKRYGDFLTSRLFVPLGMKSTGVYDPEEIVPNRASGYSRAAGKIHANVFLFDPSIPAGAGGLQSSVNDLVKWDAALASGKLLSAPLQAEMETPPVLPHGVPTTYGMGWISQQVNGHRLIWHNGAIPGAMGFIGRFPHDHLTVIILSNMMPLDSFDDNFLPLGLGLAACYVPALAPVKEVLPVMAIPDSDPQTAALLRTVSAQFAAGKLDKSLFAPAMQPILTPATVDPVHALLAPLGPMTALTLLKRAPDSSALYRAVYGTTAVLWLVAVDNAHKITLLSPRRE